MTIALQYLKEMDVIHARRSEATAGKQTTTETSRKKGKGKGGAKAQAAPTNVIQEEE